MITDGTLVVISGRRQSGADVSGAFQLFETNEAAGNTEPGDDANNKNDNDTHDDDMVPKEDDDHESGETAGDDMPDDEHEYEEVEEGA